MPASKSRTKGITVATYAFSAFVWTMICVMKLDRGHGPSVAPAAFYLTLATAILFALTAAFHGLAWAKQRNTRTEVH